MVANVYNTSMSLVGEILEKLWNTDLKYKGIPVNIFGVPQFNNRRVSVSGTIHRLKKNGLIEKQKNGWLITDKGKELYSKKLFFKKFESPFKKNSPRNLIVMFDVPHDKRQHRDWLRKQLREYDYIMIQKSVWIGPSPLPKEFINYIGMIKLKNCVKIFGLNKKVN
jgi:DNA-binding transcriptional regulator PaaX